MGDFDPRKMLRRLREEIVIELELPYPLTVNHMYQRTRFGGIAISKKGKAYKDDVGKRLAATKPLDGRLGLLIAMYPPDRRKRDLDNVLKCLLDSLNGYAWHDDNQIDFLQIRRWLPVKNGLIKIQIKPMSGEK